MEAPGVDGGLGVCGVCAQVYGTDLHCRLSISPALNIHLWCAGGGGAGIPNIDADDNLKLKQTVSLSAPVFLLPCVVGYPPKHFLTILRTLV